MSFTQSDLLLVKRVKGKGLGVFARRFIARGTIIEKAPVITAPIDDLSATELANYCFTWSKGTVALALGYGSIYNHSYTPNADYHDRSPRTKVFRAIRDIQPGEEITINYNGRYDDRTDVGFEVR